MLRTLTLALLSLPLLGLSAHSVPPAPAHLLLPPPDTACLGCAGIGGLESTATSAQGGTLTISVAFPIPGECKWVFGTTEGGQPTCRSVKGCDPLVTREWEGLSPGTPLKFTVTMDGHTLVLQNPAVANTGSGTGANDFDSAEMPCDDAKVRTFGVECVPCGMAVSTQVRCTSCSSF